MITTGQFLVEIRVLVKLSKIKATLKLSAVRVTIVLMPDVKL